MFENTIKRVIYVLLWSTSLKIFISSTWDILPLQNLAEEAKMSKLRTYGICTETLTNKASLLSNLSFTIQHYSVAN